MQQSPFEVVQQIRKIEYNKLLPGELAQVINRQRTGHHENSPHLSACKYSRTGFGPPGEDQEGAIAAGFYVAGVYREKASGARADRPELLRMIQDLQPGETVVAEKIDRISRLPLPEAERLVQPIRDKGAYLAIPGVIDLSDLADAAAGVAKIVLQSVQDMLLRLALQSARDDYEDRRERQRQGVELAKQAGKYAGRKHDANVHARILALRAGGNSIAVTAKLSGYSQSQVKRICAVERQERAVK